MNSFAVNLADAAPDAAAAAAMAAAVDEGLRPRSASASDALHARFARTAERVSSTRASGPIRIDLDPRARRGHTAPEAAALDAWAADPSVEEPERWDGMS